MELSESIIDEIVARICRVSRPERIILFGSAATGTMAESSDIDLLVLESGDVNTRHEAVDIQRCLRGLDLDFDAVVMRTESFERQRQRFGGIAYPASRYGKELYVAA